MTMKTSRWFLPFKFKLTLVISTIVLLVLLASYHFVKSILESRFNARIQADFTATQLMVQKLFDESFIQLTTSFQSLLGHGLIKELFTDPDFDQVTRDDLVQDEIYRYYQGTIDVIVLADTTGKVIAGNQLGNDLRAGITRTGIFLDCVNTGKSGILFFFANHRYYQLLIEPYFLNELMVGIMVLGNEITVEEMNRIQEISAVDLGFLKEGQVFLSTRWSPQPQHHQRLLTAFAATMQNADIVHDLQAHAMGIVYRKKLLNERFLFAISPYEWQSPALFNTPSGRRIQFIPTYLMEEDKAVATMYVTLKSLDRELAFLKEILEKLILIGVFGIGIAVLTGFLLSLKITKPIACLQQATGEVAKGNLKYRLQIDSHDEFHHLGTAFNSMITGLAEKERVRAIMNKVVSEEIATEMLTGECLLGGEEKHATILFSDIRDFTSLTEGMQPTELLELLNRYFTQMSACIDRHHGVIDKYIGDAIMALFGVPRNHANDALDAVLAAQEMMFSLQNFNRALGARNQKHIQIGIGINSGILVAGNMGAENRLNYTVLGDAVNLASRLEGLCKYYGVSIIISEATWHAAQVSAAWQSAAILIRELDSVQVKGKTTAIKVYQVFEKNPGDEDNIKQLIKRFDEGRQLFLDHKFEACYLIMKELQKQWPSDGPIQVFSKRCVQYREHPEIMNTEFSDNIFIALGK